MSAPPPKSKYLRNLPPPLQLKSYAHHPHTRARFAPHFSGQNSLAIAGTGERQPGFPPDFALQDAFKERAATSAAPQA